MGDGVGLCVGISVGVEVGTSVAVGSRASGSVASRPCEGRRQFGVWSRWMALEWLALRRQRGLVDLTDDICPVTDSPDRIDRFRRPHRA